MRLFILCLTFLATQSLSEGRYRGERRHELGERDSSDTSSSSSGSTSSLFLAELRRLLASNEFSVRESSRQSGMWPVGGSSRCSRSYTRDTNYNKNQNLDTQIKKLLGKYPRCGLTRLSLTASPAPVEDPDKRLVERLSAHHAKKNSKHIRSRRSAAHGQRDVKSPQVKIVGGRQTRVGEWPWLAAIGLKVDDGQQCGGTLIADRWILTAAHCFDDKEKLCQYNVRLGARNWMYGDDNGNTPFDSNIDAIIRHPDYDSDTNANDIALMKLSKSVTMDDHGFINAICLPKQSQSAPVNTVCLAAGWGNLATNSTVPVYNSRQVELPIISYKDPCGSYERGTIQKGMICAGYVKGGRDTCQGDSGGPLIWKPNNQWTQVALTSFGEDCAKPKYPGIYTDVGYYLHWITSVITRNSNTLQ